MNIDYSKMQPREFEKLVKDFLEKTYVGSTWELTESSGDGNKDVVCKYSFMGNDFEHWAEAKFTGSKKPHSLQKGQLDPTLVSALLCPKHVSISFISNSNMPRNYIYRLTDFKLKTNIGINLVLKDKFEEWLFENPDICDKYHINLNGGIPKKNIHIEIEDILICEQINNGDYAFIKKLKKNELYYLYLIIDSNDKIEDVSLSINEHVLAFWEYSNLTLNAAKFAVESGISGYKLIFIPTEVYEGNLLFSIKHENKIVAKKEINNISIIDSPCRPIAYSQQQKHLLNIKEFIKQANEENHAISITGGGSTGKSYLLQDLAKELNNDCDLYIYSFSNNYIYNCKQLCELLLSLNIGKLTDFDPHVIMQAISLVSTYEKRIFLAQIVQCFDKSADEIIDHLIDLGKESRLLFANKTKVRKVFILEDLHKINQELIPLINHLFEEFNQLENNQILICVYRPSKSNFDERIIAKNFPLVGLSYNDKLQTLKTYINFFNNNIIFHRASDDILAFSNVLNALIKEYENEIPKDIISWNAKVIKSFRNMDVINKNIYTKHLKEFIEERTLIEIVFLIETGIDYNKLSELFAEESINFLIDNKIFKIIHNLVFPIHDYYVDCYWDSYNIEEKSLVLIENMAKEDFVNALQYITILLRSGYKHYFKNIKKARELRDFYFKKTKFHESYLLAKEIVKKIDLDEVLEDMEIYDIFVLATSAFYKRSANDIIDLYELIIKNVKPHKSSKEIMGIYYRSYTELINQYYWNLDLSKLKKTLIDIYKLLPECSLNSNEEMRFAYIHKVNRQMVTDLLMNDYNSADSNFKICINESQRLDIINASGYAYMDYGKGLYTKDITAANEYMHEALKVFSNTDYEHRRLLDCICETAYIKCLINNNAETVKELHEAARQLFINHFEELYAKALLKLAAISLCRSEYNTNEILDYILEAEFILRYEPCNRLKMIFYNIKAAYYYLTNEYDISKNLTNKSLKICKSLGKDYSQVIINNLTVKPYGIVKMSHQCHEYDSNYYKIDNRIW